MKSRLPKLPSDCLALALNDLRKVERSEKYEVNMNNWHVPHCAYSKCEVCLAGAVMAKTLGADPKVWTAPSKFSDPEGNRLAMIDSLRTGRVCEAIKYWPGLRRHERNRWKGQERYIPSYSYNRVGFFREVGKLARELKGVGL